MGSIIEDADAIAALEAVVEYARKQPWPGSFAQFTIDWAEEVEDNIAEGDNPPRDKAAALHYDVDNILTIIAEEFPGDIEFFSAIRDMLDVTP